MEVATRAVPAVVTLSVFTVLSMVIVGLRVYTRVVLVKNPGADDFLIVGAVVCAVGFFITFLLQVKYGLGSKIEKEDLERFLISLWGTIPLYNGSLSFCKLSIGVQYYRVFRTPTMQRIIKAVLIILVLYTLWAVLGTIFTCVPVHKWWRPSANGSCLSRNNVMFANTGLNIGTDLALLALPLPLIHKLQIPRRQKFVLVGVFMCGALACAMSISRIYPLYKMEVAPLAKQSVQGVNMAIMSGLEINVGIICASVPALKAFGALLVPKFLTSNFYGRSRTPGGGRYMKQKNAGGSGAGTPAIGPPNGSSSDTTVSGRPQITIKQSFEMNTISADETGLGIDGKNARESAWEVSCYAPAMLRGREP